MSTVDVGAAARAGSAVKDDSMARQKELIAAYYRRLSHAPAS